MHRAQEAVRVGRQVNPRRLGLEVQDGAGKGRVLVRESVVLLPGPGTRLDVVDGAEVPPLADLAGNLGKLGVLRHHDVDDAHERLVAREQDGAPCERVALHEALAAVLREDFDDAPAAGAGVVVPLEVTTGAF